jgi:hypothetical protein
MAWTDTTLKTALQEYLQTDEATFVSNLNVIITQAEDRILKNVQLPDFRKNVTGTMTASNQYLGTPTDFLAPYSLAIDNSGYEYLVFKDVNFIREAYPDASVTGAPKYYGIWDDDFFILGPTPGTGYTTELHYFYKPESITTATTSWLGDHAESTLLAACLLEGYIFLKGDPDLMQVYESRYKESLSELKLLGEGRNTTDQYRIG